MHKGSSRFMDSFLTRITMLRKGYLNTTRQSHTYAKRAGINGRQRCVQESSLSQEDTGAMAPHQDTGRTGSKDPVGLEVLKTNLECQNSLHRSQLSVKSC